MARNELRISPDIRERFVHNKTFGFDVIGTLLDVRGSLITEGPSLVEKYNKRYDLNIKVNWEDFADQLRSKYGILMDEAQKAVTYTPLEILLKNAIQDLIRGSNLEQLPQEEIEYLSKAWERAKPWPDVHPGLKKLKTKFNIVPVTNANISLITNLSHNNNFPWDHILSAETFKKYKNPDFYLKVATYLDFSPSSLGMIASHPGDLFDAEKAGWKTLVFVRRPYEFGSSPRTVAPLLPENTIIVNGINELADKLLN